MTGAVVQTGWLPALTLAAPWLGLLILAALGPRARTTWLLAWPAVPALMAALTAADGAGVTLPALLGGARFGIDATARAFLLPAAVLWTAAGWFAAGWIRAPRARRAFTGFWLAAMAGSFGLILAQDLLAFYVCFALMSFAAYGLVIHHGTGAALGAGRAYLAMMVAGELALFTGVAFAALGSEVGEPVPFAAAVEGGALVPVLFALGFGIKLGAPGLHAWLPLAHPVAPAPASALLSGVMIKAGALGWWRVADPTVADLSAWGTPLIAIGLVGALLGVARGLAQHDLKRLLAWSSISQMGLVTVLLGLAVTNPAARVAATAGVALWVIHHGLAKGALFLGTGVLESSGGAARRIAWALLWLPALALAGLPGTSGALAKAALERAADATPLAAWLVPAQYLASTATTLLMLRFMVLARSAAPPVQGARLRTLWTPWVIVLGAGLTIPWLGPEAAELAARALSPGGIFSGLWPMALALGLAAAALAAGVRVPRAPPAPPASPVPRVARPPGRYLRRRLALARAAPARVSTWLAHRERYLHRWPVVGHLVMLVTLGLMLVLWLAHG